MGLNHSIIGPEHLLLAIARADDSMATKVLHELGVTSGQIISAVEHSTGLGQTPPSRKPVLTDRMQRVIELAFHETRQMKDDSIGTEHLLLGLVGQGESVAGNVLRELGLDLNNVHPQIMHHHSKQSPQ